MKKLWILVFCCLATAPMSGFLADFFAGLDALSRINERNRAELTQSIKSIIGGTPNIWKSKTGEDSPQTRANRVALTFDELPGMPQEIKEVVDFFKAPERFTRVGAHMPRGILLYGPPGTGKTSVARVIAAQTNAEFFQANGSEFIEIYVGIGPMRIRELFAKARNSTKAVIFIDEIDAIGKRRSTDWGNSEYDQTLNQLLTEMDGFKRDTNILVIAATNRIDGLDPALLRPGRFDRLIKIDVPDEQTRVEILCRYLGNVPWAGDAETIRRVAALSAGMSGAELEHLVNEAAIIAARAEREQIINEDLQQALTREKKRK